MRAPIVPLLGALALSACATPRGYVYEPVTTTAAEVAGRAAASYPVPAFTPEGSAQIVSFGMTEVRPEGAARMPAIAMRLIVSNESKQSWTVDARVQALVFDDGQEATAAYAIATGGQPPLVDVPAGTTRAVDLLFPLPAGKGKPSALPRFDAVWSVRTPGHVVTGRTPFARSTVTTRAYADVAAPFWLDPLNPTVSTVTLTRLQGPYLHPAPATP